MQNSLNFLIFGDIVGIPGRAIFQKYISKLKNDYKAQVIIVNGENSASDGRGITKKIMKFFKHNHVNVVTSGNHIWAKREIYQYLNENRDLLRPANFSSECPGIGYTVIEIFSYSIAIVNLQGRVYMKDLINDPFRTIDSILTYLKSKTNMIIVDFHAEATSEKVAMGYYLDGRISALVGTHTHIQTSDNRILPKGSAYITDLGMSGSLNSVIGVKKGIIIEQYLKQMPIRYEVEDEKPYILNGIFLSLDTLTGKAIKIDRISILEDNINIDNCLLGE
jgi:metallophosphoesterase (TIGR00282 family)